MATSRKVSGPQLFLRYAWPCAEWKLMRGKISQEEYDLLNWHVENTIKPDPALLRRTFGKAVQNLELFAQANKYDTWRTETVAKFWRFNHEGKGLCAVQIQTVQDVREDGNLVVSGIDIPLKNIYLLDLKKGDRVSIHMLEIIEKIKS